MKRALVFVALTVAAIGMATGPASAAPSLEKFSIDSKGGVYPGYGAGVSGKIKCPVGQSRFINVLLSTTDAAGGDGALINCTGQTQGWDIGIDGYYFPGKANACATTEKFTLNVKPRTCRRITLVSVI
jgi:hypothetical protein